MACLWGLTGLTVGAELCDTDGRMIVMGGVDTSQVSWTTTLYLGGKTSPDDPCNHFQVYIASLHWAVMTLTSIGYGDIVPVRVEEYIVGILCMLVGGVLWAYVIGSVCSVISNNSPVERNFEQNTDLLNLAMEEARVPSDARHEYREYLREAKAYDRRICFRSVAENFSPMLRKQLLFHSAKGCISSVYYFSYHDTPEAFLMDIAPFLMPRLFARFETLDIVRDMLCLIDRGTVAHCGWILVHPSAFHDDFIVSDRRYMKSTRSVSLTYTQLLVLARGDLEHILESHPVFARKIWKTALKRATCRCVLLVAEAYRSWRRSGSTGSMSLREAFDRFRSLNPLDMLDIQGASRGPTLEMKHVFSDRGRRLDSPDAVHFRYGGTASW
uniref:Potassium channel domain-containing protein n=1 Tax=Alexandrium andersonii TaxID=327968 RepID=A0A7S2J2K3_9DINO|mmetsp:Transcript_93133/g.208468  ORF Transcript_93133/g.208468 Transcript_93133/m.208468 type:complete len:384 (+) Transcript_93133:1-1152(+)